MKPVAEKPSIRKPLGVILIIAILVVYAAVIANIAGPILRLSPLVQAPVWLVLGIVWVLPIRPLVRWIEIGRFRK